MSRFALLTAILLSAATLASADSDTRRYLYMSTPDGAQKEGRAEGNGILVFDIDDGHKLVRRIDVPIFEEGLRGFAGSLKTGYAYYSSTNRTLGAYDLVNEKKVWASSAEPFKTRVARAALFGTKQLTIDWDWAPKALWVDKDASSIS